MRKKKVAFLSRVSTMDQHTSIENQKDSMDLWLERNPDCEFYKLYEDEGISGAKGYKREAWLRLIEDGKKGLYDVMVAKSFSRFGRNQTETLQAIKDLRANNIRVVFLEDTLDSQKDTHNFGLFAWLAEQEAQKTSERIKMVWDNFNIQGKVHVTLAPYGYDYNKEIKNFIVNDIEKDVIIKIFNLYLEGNGFNKIAKMLSDENIPTKRGGKWAGATIRTILTNEFYLGTLVQGKSRTLDVTMKESRKIDSSEWYRHEGNHEAIIDRKAFEKVGDLIEERSVKAKSKYTKEHSNIKRNSNKSLFSNLLVCGDCGATMTIKRKKRENYKAYYQCLEYDRISLKSGHNSNRITEDLLIEVIRDELTDLSSNNFTKLKNVKSKKQQENNNKKIEKEITSLNKKIDDQVKLANNLLMFYTQSKITDVQYQLQNESINNGLTQLIDRRTKLENELKQDISKDEEKEIFEGIERILNKKTEDWNNQDLKEFIKNITIYRDGVIKIKVRYFD